MVPVGMHIQQAGATTAPVVVLLHGSGRAGRMWEPGTDRPVRRVACPRP